MAAFLFGPLGGMVPLKVSRGVTDSPTRTMSELVTSGGVRYVQRGRRAPRTWQVGRAYEGPGWAALLADAAHGLLGQCWLYEVAAARENMVPAELSAGTGAPVIVGGRPMGALPVGHTVTVQVLAGRTYTVSLWSAAAAGSTLASLTGSTTGTVKAPPGTGPRPCATSFTPLADGAVTVTVSNAAASGLRVHDGGPDGRFYSGHGTPCKVAVQDPQRTLELVVGQETRSAYQVTLMEVGKPGSL